MASTYVNNLRLNEMATGDASGTWGTNTNTNLELIGEALGYGTEAITTNADTHSTVIADGGTDPGRSLYLKYTGTLDSTCTITITPNTCSKVWIVENATSGSQSIIFKQGSGASVTIPTGSVAVCYSDGAGSGAAMYNAFTDLSLAGTTVYSALNDGSTTLTSTAAELNLVDGSSAGSVVNSKAVIYSSAGVVNATDMLVTGAGNRSISITSSNGIASMEIGGVTGAFIDLKLPSSDDYDLRLNAGATGGGITIASGSFSILGSDETMATFTDNGAVTLYYDNAIKLATASGGIAVTGDIDVSGDVDVDGTLETDALSIASTTVTSTAAELNILDGVTSTAAELNILDGVTSTAAELNLVDGITAGTVAASKAVIVDSNKDITGYRNLTSTGTITAATNVTVSSDIRLKSNIETIDSALDKVKEMRGVYFDKHGSEDKRSVGVIAQEMQEIMPEAVVTDDTEDKYLSVAYGNLVGVLIEAVKELSEEVDELKKITRTVEFKDS